MKRCLLIVLVCVCGGFAARAEGTNAPAAAATTAPAPGDETASFERKVLKRLDEISSRIEQLERERKTDQNIRERKADQMQNDVMDIRRTVERIEMKR